MYSSIFQSTTIPVLQEMVNFAQVRHTMLAGNIANLDTPGYQFRDLSVEDFQQRLQAAIEARHHPKPRSPGEPQSADTPHTVIRRHPSNVELEQQVSEMVKNQMQHNLAIAVMQSQFRLLQTAVSGNV